MATHFDNMNQNAQFRDRANGVSVCGKGIISKAPNKAGRKPLGEISNSNTLKLPQNYVSQKQQNPVDFTCFGDEKGVPKSTLPLNRKKSLSRPVKNATPGARKPLGDISNSWKPALPQIPKKTKVKDANVLELGDTGIDKGFLHNHAECVKNQRKAVDLDYILETVGLRKDSSWNTSHSLQSSTEEDMDLHKEISELMYEECSPPSSKTEMLTNHNWSPCCKNPKSLSLFMQWGNVDAFECSLVESPSKLEN
ncbi:unnamed protein product [Rhodiola kirilowii]